jgi:hypothetical protein
LRAAARRICAGAGRIWLESAGARGGHRSGFRSPPLILFFFSPRFLSFLVAVGSWLAPAAAYPFSFLAEATEPEV